MLYFFRFIFGYLTIKINGENAEQLLNKATKNGIEIWNLKFKNKSIFFNVSIKNFKLLKMIKRGMNCKIKIKEKHGIVFKIQRYKNRYGLIVGLITFVAILYILSNYIWIINVEGNKQLSFDQIMVSCNEIGIYHGVKKDKINSKYDAQRLQLIEDGIAWCSINVEGCVLTVNLSETAISDADERKTPSNIKASIEGKIKKINAYSGNVVVKVGDTVAKGDLLVSGIIENMSSSLFVHSDGEIIAETKRVFSAKSDFTNDVTYETSNKLSRTTVEFFGIKIPLYLGNVKKPHVYNKEIKKLTLFDRRIPIKLIKEEFNLTAKDKITFDKKTLEEKLYLDIQNQIKKFEFISIAEYKKEIIETDKGILLKIECVCEENIAVQDKILFNTKN